MDLKDLCTKIVNICCDTGSYIKNESINFDLAKIEIKGLHDFVSYVDKNAEKQLVEKLESLIPEAGFIAEEGTSLKRGKRYNWIIDPLDGTTNFLHNVHPHSISIALADEDEIIAGVVYEVAGHETFVACGRFDAFFEYGLNRWDIAAGLLLVREAGGFVSDFSGSKKNITGTEIIAANNIIFPEVLNNLSNFMSGKNHK